MEGRFGILVRLALCVARMVYRAADGLCLLGDKLVQWLIGRR